MKVASVVPRHRLSSSLSLWRRLLLLLLLSALPCLGKGVPKEPQLPYSRYSAIANEPIVLLQSINDKQGTSQASSLHDDDNNNNTLRRLATTQSTTTSTSSSNDDFICQLHINRILPEDGRITAATEAAEEAREFTTCSPWSADRGGTMGVYRITPPAWILTQHKHVLLRGVTLFLVIPGGTIQQDEIFIPNENVVTVAFNPPSSLSWSESLHRQLQSSSQRGRGAKKTVMLRIRGRDAQPDFSLAELYRYLLTDDLSAKRQLERCSHGLVTLDASRYGVLDVPLDTNIEGLTNTQVMNLAETYVNDVILATDAVVKNIREWADFLIFVVPPGTGSWAAFATVSGKQSVFNNRWGGYLGALLHELGIWDWIM